MSNYGYDRASSGQSSMPVLFSIVEPRNLELSSLKADLDDVANLASFAGLLGSEAHHEWRRLRQDDLRVIRLSYGSPFEVIAQLPELAGALAPHMTLPSIGLVVVASNQLLKHIRGTFRDYAAGQRELSEGAKFRAEAEKARAEAEDIRARSARARYEVQQQREAISEEERIANLVLPDLLVEAASQLPSHLQQNLLDMLETLRLEDQRVLERRGSSAPARPEKSKERSILRSLARLVLKEDVNVGPYVGGHHFDSREH